MEPIKNHTGFVYPLNRTNVDTDQIIPKQFLKSIERTGFGRYLFFNWRYDQKGAKRADFTLNDPKYEETSILLAQENFGCGSSREHAAWALLDYGFRVVIAPSFADIFYNNSLKNGLLPIQIDQSQIDDWMEEAEDGPFQLQIDLENQRIIDGNGTISRFEISPYYKEKLIKGWDDIDLTMIHEEKISAYEEMREIR